MIKFRNMFKKKQPKVKEVQLSDINLFDFKICMAGDLNYFNNNTDKWENLLEKYEEKIKAKGNDVVLELRKQIAIKENTILALNNYLFIIRESFKAYTHTRDEFYITQIIESSEVMATFGIKFNIKNNITKEFNRCVKLVMNKKNDIKQDLEHLTEATKGGMTFDAFISLVLNTSGLIARKQKDILMDEFCDQYNLMISKK